MKVVVDTNVLVSGLLNPFGPPGELVRMTADGSLELCFDARILAEYREVLLRPHFGFEPELVEALLAQIESGGHLSSGRPLHRSLPHADDEAFLEIASAEGVSVLVTGNLRHYPPDRRQGVRVVDPREFIESLRRGR